MKTKYLSKFLGSAALFLTIAIRSTFSAEATECKQGICIHVGDVTRDGNAGKAIWFSGAPRAGDYVTHFYQVRGLPGPVQQEQVDMGDKSKQFVLTQTSNISVQACRVTSKLINPTVCTGWVVFRVEVSPRFTPITKLKISPTTAGPAAPAIPAPASKPAAPAPASMPAAPAGATSVPGITASPGIVTIPAGQTQGTTTLTWDAGADHPYAEVWVRVDDQDETKIVEQGKGSRQVKVQSGKTYLYTLSDSGVRLATVSVNTN